MSKPRPHTPTIPAPYADIQSLHATVMALKEAVELLLGQRGDIRDVPTTWGDLMDRGLIRKDQVPIDVGRNRN